MNSKNGGREAPSFWELEECLRKVAQALEWHAHGSCRGFHAGKPLRTGEATALAKSTLGRVGVASNAPSIRTAAALVGKSPSTVARWKRTNPELYRAVMEYAAKRGGE